MLSGFFFQAEDGIRYWSVTGVQTCALPIWDRAGRREQVVAQRTHDRGARRGPGKADGDDADLAGGAQGRRSEERRVGKEGRGRGATAPERKQNQRKSGQWTRVTCQSATASR